MDAVSATPPTTKKFLAALTAQGHAYARAPFVVPSLSGEPWFIELQNGKKHETAYLVYVGLAISADDVLNRMSQRPTDDKQARDLIESLLIELQDFKIGNVVAVDQCDGHQVRLRLVSMTPKSRPGPKLPG